MICRPMGWADGLNDSETLLQATSSGVIGPLGKLVGGNYLLFFTSVAAVAALGSAVVAAVYTYLTFQLVRAQREPKVVAYVCSDPDRRTMLMIRIENIGRDVATDIAFKSSRPIPAKGFGVSSGDARSQEQFMTRGPLIDGILVLGPGDRRDITWGQFNGLSTAVGDQPIELEFTYYHDTRKLRGRSHLEVASYIDTDASENPPAAAARSLDKLAKAADALVQYVRRREQAELQGAQPAADEVRVDSMDPPDGTASA